MNPKEYLSTIRRFVQYPPEAEKGYLTLGLIAEVGELCGVYAKALRKGVEPDHSTLMDEMGDVLWFCMMSGDYANITWSKRSSKRKIDEYLYPSLLYLAEYASAGKTWDCIQWLRMLLDCYGWSLEDIAIANVAKLEARLAAGTIKDRPTASMKESLDE